MVAGGLKLGRLEEVLGECSKWEEKHLAGIIELENSGVPG